MRNDWTSQTGIYGGRLVFPAVYIANSSTPIVPQVTIKLRITSIDEPIRVPKTTEISLIPTTDFVNWSDGSANAIFFGAVEPLQTTLEGSMITPYVQVTDAITSLNYIQARPTVDSSQSGTPFDGVSVASYAPGVLQNFTGFTNGDMIWMYLEGKMARVGPSSYMRIDPVQYYDPFGNVYSNPVLAEFACSRVAGNVAKETFQMKIWLET